LVFHYRSYFLDYDTGLYYLKSRFYDPYIHRFISPDEAKYLDVQTPYGTNLYAYCNNNPVMIVDPSGHFGIVATLLIATGIGLALGFGMEVATQVYNNGDWNWDASTWNWWEIGRSSLIGAASGFAYGLGGVAGGLLKGSFHAISIAGKALTVSQSVGLLLGTAAVTNFAAGVAGYAMYSAANGMQNFDIVTGVSEGIEQLGKGLLSFFTAIMFVGVGAWNVGVGAKNTFGSIVGRSISRFIENCIFDNII